MRIRVLQTSRGALLQRLAILIVISLCASPGWSETIVYDNTDPISLSTDCTGELECGDEITLAAGPRTVSEFEFAYLGDFNQDGDEAVQIRFYANDGPGGEPGTMLFDSGDVAVSPSMMPQFVVLTGLSVSVPDTFTWSLQATGLDFENSERVKIPFAGPPTVGSSDPSFIWFNSGGGWVMFGRSSDHYARVTAMPEPGAGLSFAASTLTLAALARRRVRRR